MSKASETGKRSKQLETRLANDLNKANIEISKGNTTTVGYKNAMQVVRDVNAVYTVQRSYMDNKNKKLGVRGGRRKK